MLNGAKLLVDFLEAKKVDCVFAISGAGNLAILDEISKSMKIRIIFGHHEQSLVMAAQGYSRVSGKPGVVLVTTGGGTTNVVTGVLSAHLDSIPIFLISGNESSFHCSSMQDFRAYGVQGFDSVALTKPITKLSDRIMQSVEILPKLQNSWQIMQTGRLGPVHIDFPMDVQRKTINQNVEIEILKTKEEKFDISATFEEILELLKNSKQPIFYLGNGLRNNNQHHRILDFLHRHDLPYLLSWSALDFSSSDERLNIGKIGIYGERSSNLLLQQCDLFLSIGSRLAIPQVGYDKMDFARKAKKIVVDIDKTELTKFPQEDWITCHSSSEHFLDLLISSWKPDRNQLSSWQGRINHIRGKFNKKYSRNLEPEISNNTIHSLDAIEAISKNLDKNAVIVTDVGAALLSGHYNFDIKKGQRFFTSQGLGEMGFGLPAAIGAHFASQDKKIVCLNTDGAIMFNLQDLQLVNEFKIPLKLFIFANEGYAMIKISQNNLFEGNLVGSSLDSGISFPNFENIAVSFEMTYKGFSKLNILEDELSTILSDDNSYLIEIKMDPNQKYFPRLATSKLKSGEFVSPPLEDLDPKMSIEDLQDGLGYQPNQDSFNVRK